MTRTLNLLLLAALIAIVSTACRHAAGADTLPDTGDTLTSRSELLTLVDHRNGIVTARVADPWNGGKTLATYLLVDRNIDDTDLPAVDNAVVVRVPVQAALVYSSVHTQAFEELGVANRIAGVADADYFASTYIRNAIADGRITDVGNSMSPSVDRIIDLDPDVVILSPYENSGHGVLEKTGIAVIDMADYMEPTPLGRAEWILFIGALTGRLDSARNIYDNVVADYNALITPTPPAPPLVLCEMPFSGVWYQPGGDSYVARIINDAGGRVVFYDDNSRGSVQADIANVYDRAVDADLWLIKNAGPVTRATLTSITPIVRDIRAFRNGRVFNANTLEVPYYDDIAFHPERILADMVAVIAADSTTSLRYFAPVR